MEEGKMMCFESLQDDIDAIADESARTCLTNFITLCSALYATEAEEEQASQEVVSMCRLQVFDAHKKSLRILETLLSSGSSYAQVDTVLQKMKELADVNEAMNLHFGPAPPFIGPSDMGSQEHGEKLAEVTVRDKSVTSDANMLIEGIVKGLDNLADKTRVLRKEENEVRATNRKLSERLESLKQEAGCHPAIEVYTARNCHSPLGANARREEYVQYACALERVIKKVRKTAEALRASGHNDLSAVEQHFPALRTLSQSLAHLHANVQDACSSPVPEICNLEPLKGKPSSHMQPLADEQNRKPVGNGMEEETSVMAEKLHHALVSVGSVRRCVDAGLGHVSAVLGECAGDWDAELMASGAAERTAKTPSEKLWTGAVLTSLRQSSGGDDLLAIDMLKFLPLEDKDCRDYLMSGTKLLRSAVEDLTRAVKIKSTVVEARCVLDNALCQPFPETSICRLELIRLLTSQELPEFQSPPAPRHCTSKVPKSEENKKKGQAAPKPTQPRKLNGQDRKRRKGTSPTDRKRQTAQVPAKKEDIPVLHVSGVHIPTSSKGARKISI